MGHYAVTCPERKKGKRKNVAASAQVEDFSCQFEQELSLIVGLSSSVTPTVWYIDSGASRHMTGVRGQFAELTERTLDIEVVLGDDRTVSATGVGTVSFKRESLPPLKLTKVLYVPGLKKSLVSVSSIEDQGSRCCLERDRYSCIPKVGASLQPE